MTFEFITEKQKLITSYGLLLGVLESRSEEFSSYTTQTPQGSTLTFDEAMDMVVAHLASGISGTP